MKWVIPGGQFIKIQREDHNTFEKGLAYLAEQGYELTGAVQDFRDTRTGQNYMCYPIKQL